MGLDKGEAYREASVIDGRQLEDSSDWNVKHYDGHRRA